MKKFFIIAMILLLGINIYTVIKFNKNINTSSESQNSYNLTKGDAADFKLKDLNGNEVSLSNYRGKNVLLNFWATWCPPCKAEMPDIEKLYQENSNSDLVILAVNLGEGKQNVLSFIGKNNYNFKVLLDSDQEVARKYKVSSIPTSFFINKEGNIVSRKVGSISLEQMNLYVNSLNK